MEHLFPDTESRLALLYAVEHLGALSDQQLLVFFTDLSLMNYFSLQLNLAELLKKECLALINHPFGSLYRITSQGQYTLREFQHLIGHGVLRTMDAQMDAYRTRFRAEQHAPASESTLPDGTLTIRLQLLENDLLILDIRLRPDHRFSCIDQRWQRCAQAVYSLIYDVLSEGFDPAGQDMSIPDGISLMNASRQEWTLFMGDRPVNPSFTLILSLADPLLAAHCAQQWASSHEVLKEGILALLKQSLEE